MPPLDPDSTATTITNDSTEATNVKETKMPLDSECNINNNVVQKDGAGENGNNTSTTQPQNVSQPQQQHQQQQAQPDVKDKASDIDELKTHSQHESIGKEGPRQHEKHLSALKPVLAKNGNVDDNCRKYRKGTVLTRNDQSKVEPHVPAPLMKDGAPNLVREEEKGKETIFLPSKLQSKDKQIVMPRRSPSSTKSEEKPFDSSDRKQHQQQHETTNEEGQQPKPPPPPSTEQQQPASGHDEKPQNVVEHKQDQPSKEKDEKGIPVWVKAELFCPVVDDQAARMARRFGKAALSAAAERANQENVMNGQQSLSRPSSSESISSLDVTSSTTTTRTTTRTTTTTARTGQFPRYLPSSSSSSTNTAFSRRYGGVPRARSNDSGLDELAISMSSASSQSSSATATAATVTTAATTASTTAAQSTGSAQTSSTTALAGTALDRSGSSLHASLHTPSKRSNRFDALASSYHSTSKPTVKDRVLASPVRSKSNDSSLTDMGGLYGTRLRRRRRVSSAVVGHQASIDLLLKPPLSEKSSSSTSKAAEIPTVSYEWKRGWMTKTSDGKNMVVRLHESCTRSTRDTATIPVERMDTDVLLASDPAKMPLVPPHDLVTIKHFTEPAIVECLERRFARGLVYTSTGPVLLAINPFRSLPDLYSNERMQDYWNQAEQGLKSKLPPHVYETADGAFRSMMRGMELALGRKNVKIKCDQSILCSGESGAGKTVTTKYLMKYLTALSQRAARQASQKSTARSFFTQQKKNSDSDDSKKEPDSSGTDGPSVKSAALLSASIEDQVLQSNPILEAFGNARTVRNDNSSRFGKFIQMQFTSTGRLVGTQIDTYLLEKVRLVHQGPGERNYHVFYQLLSALGEEELEAFHLAKKRLPHDYSILNQSGTFTRRDGVSDVQTYSELVEALKVMGFGEEDRQNVLGVTAAILHASNITFEDVSSEECGLIRGNEHLKPACELLGVSEEALNDALCYFSISVTGQTLRRPQLKRNAIKGLEALMKATYGALFTYLVSKVNELVAFRETDASRNNPLLRAAASIDILDIFGFESFEVNSFEQLCINYCNEALQQQFNTFMLKNEQAEYASEGIDWDFIKFPENQDVLDLICDRKGILSCLDDMCRAPSATDVSFANQLFTLCQGRDRFSARKTKAGAARFAIIHYAGSVEYSTDGFVEKNRDDLPRETADLLMSSKNSFVHKLAEIISAATAGSAAANDPGTVADPDPNTNKFASKKQSAKATTSNKSTVGGYFRQQVQDLRGKIDSTAPNYVRCIKPNAQLVPKRFDRAMVAEQLRCGGILQAVSVTRDGFTLHYTFSDFVKRYGNLVKKSKAPAEKNLATGSSSMKQTCKVLVDTLLEEIKEELQKAQKDPGENQLGDDEDEETDPPETLIQFGKSKVLLKHYAFESLERRLRALEDKTATRLNTIFRRHLARVAFQAARDEFRRHIQEDLGLTFNEWYRENRELYYTKRDKTDLGKIPNITRIRLETYQRQCNSSRKIVSRSSSSDALPTNVSNSSTKQRLQLYKQMANAKKDWSVSRNKPDQVDLPKNVTTSSLTKRYLQKAGSSMS